MNKLVDNVVPVAIRFIFTYAVRGAGGDLLPEGAKLLASQDINDVLARSLL